MVQAKRRRMNKTILLSENNESDYKMESKVKKYNPKPVEGVHLVCDSKFVFDANFHQNVLEVSDTKPFRVHALKFNDEHLYIIRMPTTDRDAEQVYSFDSENHLDDYNLINIVGQFLVVIPMDLLLELGLSDLAESLVDQSNATFVDINNGEKITGNKKFLQMGNNFIYWDEHDDCEKCDEIIFPWMLQSHRKKHVKPRKPRVKKEVKVEVAVKKEEVKVEEKVKEEKGDIFDVEDIVDVKDIFDDIETDDDEDEETDSDDFHSGYDDLEEALDSEQHKEIPNDYSFRPNNSNVINYDELEIVKAFKDLEDGTINCLGEVNIIHQMGQMINEKYVRWSRPVYKCKKAYYHMLVDGCERLQNTLIPIFFDEDRNHAVRFLIKK